MKVRDGSPLVLVADDDRMVRFTASKMLVNEGFSVREAKDGLEAVSIFQQFCPDIVLLDVMMPEKDGFTTCCKLRRLPGGEHVPVLIVTGLDDLDSIRQAYEAGATDFITKPINWLIVAQRIRYMYRASMVSRQLRESEANKRTLIDAIPDMIFRINREGVIIDFSAPKDSDFCLPAEKVVGRQSGSILFAETRELGRVCIQDALKTGEIQVLDHSMDVGGVRRYCESRILKSEGDVALVIVRDITERKRSEERITQLAYHDTLTGLLNRHSFKELHTQALTQAERYGRITATLFLDLDRFKRINDTLGHNIGDLLLQAVAERLKESVRKSDCSARFRRGSVGDTISRLGGDEFVILLTQIEKPQDAAKVARRILDVLSHPFILSGHEIFITASIGIAAYPIDGTSTDVILKNADTAMYSAKDQGRNNFQFYTTSMNATAFERLALENSLRKAISREELVLHYQPQVDLKSRRVIALEALIRWNHPDLGQVSPNEFIPLAEETGLILPIGAWVIREACEQIRAWERILHYSVRVTVNVSCQQFGNEDLIDVITQALKDYSIDPYCLELELTESTIMQSKETAVSMLRKLKEIGIRVALDDFGTGYSSLSYLKRFPIDIVKIDRSFIKGITDDPDDAAITMAIIAMAHSLNMTVIAEGVETGEQLAFLEQHGCDAFQGYLFSPAVPAEAVVAILHKWVSSEIT